MTTPSKIPSREWLLGWMYCCYLTNKFNKDGLEDKSRQELWKDYLEITGQEEGAV